MLKRNWRGGSSGTKRGKGKGRPGTFEIHTIPLSNLTDPIILLLLWCCWNKIVHRRHKKFIDENGHSTDWDISREGHIEREIASRSKEPSARSCWTPASSFLSTAAQKVWLDLVRSAIVVPLRARVASVRPAVVTTTSSGATINWMLSFVKLPMGQGDWPRSMAIMSTCLIWNLDFNLNVNELPIINKYMKCRRRILFAWSNIVNNWSGSKRHEYRAQRTEVLTVARERRLLNQMCSNE